MEFADKMHVEDFLCSLLKPLFPTNKSREHDLNSINHIGDLPLPTHL